MPRDSPYAGSSDLVALGDAVRLLRERRGIQQAVVSFDAGVVDKYVGMVERGRLNPSWMTLLRVVRTLDSSMGELVEIYDRTIAVIDPQAGSDVPLCPTPEALAHLRRLSYEASAAYEAKKARRARRRITSWT
jgi:transcriptional regulator with XRE-family HTH domain